MPRRLPECHPRGDYRARCAYCGVHWYRSEMWVDGSGNLVCPDEGDGRDAVTLSKLNAEAAAAHAGRAGITHRIGGDENSGAASTEVPESVSRTTYADIFKL